MKPARSTLTAILLCACAAQAADGESHLSAIRIKFLSCAAGGIGAAPLSPPPDFESQFARAVIDVKNVGAPFQSPPLTLTLFGQNQPPTSTKRIISIQMMDAHKRSLEPVHYLAISDNGEKPWNNEFAHGTTRLSIYVALRTQEPAPFPARCSIRIGPWQAERVLDAVWPTG